jgi:putative ABC transport system substrate-binding protein
MKRREFIGLVGGAATWPLVARAQPQNPVRRIGVLFGSARNRNNDQQIELLTRSLQTLGWAEGKNIEIDYRWAKNDLAQIEILATELLESKPDVILAQTTPVVEAFHRKTKNTPIVFVAVADPVISGLVASLSHPAGNITGFSLFEPSLAGKYVEILKEITPGLTTIAWLFQANSPFHLIVGPFLEEAARRYRVELVSTPVSTSSEFEVVMSRLRDNPTVGLVIGGEPIFTSNIDLVTSLALRYRVCTVYAFRSLAVGGGLISYGNDTIDQYRQAATYLDRILKGENPANLPVQAPTKLEMVVNIKTAKAIGVTIPPTLLASANEVIE